MQIILRTSEQTRSRKMSSDPDRDSKQNSGEAGAKLVSLGEPTVFVIDDDISVRESLGELIVAKGWQIETFTSAQDFLLFPRKTVPSCLVLDISLPGISGLDLQKRLSADGVNIPIIFITGFGDIPMTVRAMKAGAVEFLTKPFSHEDLFAAITQALSDSLSTLNLDAQFRELRSRHGSLSRREQEVMALAVSGLLNKQIGFELGISEITVKAHRGKVMRKMRAKSFADLVNIAAKLRLSPGSES
jgi:FixJ family two-component response regulator